MNVRVLVVDDHRLLREGLRALLGASRVVDVVGEAGDGRSAVEQAALLRPDVVLMDIGMRGLNGIEATRQIRAADPRVRVLVVSVSTDPVQVTRALEAGASGYLEKGSSCEELVTAVRAVAAGRRYVQPEIARRLEEVRSEAGKRQGLDALAPRERQVLQLLAEGETSARIAQRLGVSVLTVETHRRNLMRKLGLHGIAALTRYAIREGLTTADA